MQIEYLEINNICEQYAIETDGEKKGSLEKIEDFQR